LINGYHDPGKLGVDRWLAMIAASDEFGLPVVVVDAGTALTVDGVGMAGRHLVGYIVPGLRTMLRSLGEATAGLNIEELSTAKPGATSTSTRDAICNGVVEAARGLVDRAVRYLGEQEGRQPAVVVTGGDRRLVTYEGSSWLLCPDLVLRGLRRVAGDLNQFTPP
jgi:type III pantothenate kinase